MLKAKNFTSLIKDVGVENFQESFRKDHLGITYKRNVNGTYPVGVDLAKRQMDATEFSITEIAEHFLGQEFVQGVRNPKIADSWMKDLFEATAAVHPSQFSNISAFTSVASGLLEQQFLKAYSLPEFVAQSLMSTVPTKVNSGKLIGIPNIKFPYRPSKANEEAPSLSMQERWTWRPNLVKYNAKIAVSREDIMFDRTDNLLNYVYGVGKSMALAKEIYAAATILGVNIPATAALCPDTINGVTGKTYIYNDVETATPNATYQTAAGSGASAKYNFVNQSTGKNGITSWTDMQFIRGQMSLATEYETGYRVGGQLNTAIVSPFNFDQANYVVHNTQIFNYPTGFAQSGLVAPNTASNSGLNSSVNIVSSANFEQVLVNSGVSQANAQCYVTAGDTQSAFRWFEGWPMEIQSASPTAPELMNSQIVTSLLCSWFGAAAVVEPRYMYQFTN